MSYDEILTYPEIVDVLNKGSNLNDVIIVVANDIDNKGKTQRYFSLQTVRNLINYKNSTIKRLEYTLKLADEIIQKRSADHKDLLILFAEKIKVTADEEWYSDSDTGEYTMYKTVKVQDIDEILKEMLGDEK